MITSFADCGYRKISDPLDSKLKPQKCTDDGLNPAGPCLKQLNNKKHFIIHTPEHDKVFIIMINNVFLIILAILIIQHVLFCIQLVVLRR